MDIALMTFVVKVFWVLMRVAVVGVDGGVVDVGVVGDVDVVDDGVSDTDIYLWIAVPNSFTVLCSSFTCNCHVRTWMTLDDAGCWFSKQCYDSWS